MDEHSKQAEHNHGEHTQNPSNEGADDAHVSHTPDAGEHGGHAPDAGEHDEHGDHAGGHGGHVDHTGHELMFRNRFWVFLVLTVPVLLYSSTIQG